ncbi:uncharacterized protein FOMMEDRAFT_102353 [Fomitiporia mediterranea MF3/22]|uniref:uncharacterized protein n=1 Tax=Fomitiporia mediterranea (strain MF3/22) TaxID=694068 RepID=UPI00044080B2|nr:uncharacterized protein FOMMEDRAFT_102353 [Fomitiporia mediterranea MF3/22]EJD06532.1 hypothetical protein FOMMEDRAFT_102353 [Fomitiporia mediterranea MF3/22]
MSFSSTPLGQDRRLDHQAFLKGVPITYGTHPPPPKRVTSVNNPVPISYAYGAPELYSRSSRQPTATAQAGRTQGTDDNEEELRRTRYTQLKQRNETLSNRPGSSLGPGIITTPPQPNEATLNPTSVNIASAFHVAASSYTMAPTTTSNAWTGVGNRPGVPRSTSVEYEQQTQTTVNRRLANPPRRVPGSKPPSAAKTVPNIRSPNAEDEQVRANGRGKSPFEHISEYAQRAVSQATFLMRQRSQEPEDGRPPSRQATDATLVPPNNSNSYDYAEEEEEFQEMQKSGKKKDLVQHKRNRMSMDNKAYRPTASDEEEESDEGSDDEKRGRRRKKKRDSGGGALTNMPTIQYDKRKKKKGRSGRPGEDDYSVADDEEQAQANEQRDRRSATPLQRPPSVPRGAAPLDSSRSYDYSGTADGSADLGAGLDSIPEVDELSVLQPIHEEKSFARHGRTRSRSRSRVRQAQRSTIGGPLGKLVNLLCVSVIRLLAVIFLFIGRILGFIFSILFREPRLFLRRHRTFARLGMYAIVAGVLYLSIRFFKLDERFDLSLLPGSKTPYTAPQLPPESVDELTSRLLKLENVLASLQSDAISDRHRLDNDARRSQEMTSRLNLLESRIDKEISRMQRAGEDVRSAAFKGLESIQREVRSLQAQQSELSSRPEGAQNDEEARAKLKALEERLGSVEGGVKEALELGQNAAKAGSAVVGAGSGAHWWSKLGSGSTSGLTIKTSDGSDVTQLISGLVEQAIMHYTADGIARVDYALHSAGAYIIPSLTSQTLEIKTSYFFGLISGASLYARSPVTALHHETAVGYCWPFAGKQGYLGVKLATPVRITEFTIDHASSAVALDMRSAPRRMEVWGMVEGKDNVEKLRAYRTGLQAGRNAAVEEGRPIPSAAEEPARPSILPKRSEYIRIAEFTYDINSPQNIQTFAVPEDVKSLGIDFGLVVLAVKDNWGMEEFTCLYRFRVHGERKVELPPPLDSSDSSDS